MYAGQQEAKEKKLIFTFGIEGIYILQAPWCGLLLVWRSEVYEEVFQHQRISCFQKKIMLDFTYRSIYQNITKNAEYQVWFYTDDLIASMILNCWCFE